MSEPIDLGDLAPASRDVHFRNRAGEVERYVVREASTAAAVAYRNSNSRASRYEDGKFVGLDGLADSEPLLVGLCTFKVDDKGGASGAPVGHEAVMKWPDRVQRALYDIVKEISPRLTDVLTLESVDKQLTRLQERRRELVEERARGGAPNPNAPPPPTGGTSGSAGSSASSSTS